MAWPRRLLMREVVRDRLRGLDGGNRVLEDHVIAAALIEHEREAIEVLDASFELTAVHHSNRDRELLAADVVEKDVLNIRLAVFQFRGGRHMCRPGASPRRWSPLIRQGRRTNLD